MKKRNMGKAGILMLFLLCVIQFTGCSVKRSPDDDKEISSLNGSLTMAGSSSMEKLATALNEAFMEKQQKVRVNTEYIGSSAGVEALVKESADIANVSRPLKESEKKDGVIENVVALDGIAVITHKDNQIGNLTRNELIAIFTGKVKNWNELGGEKLPIVVIGREAGSGTRGAFEELLQVKDQCIYVNELDSTGAVKAKTASTVGAIGYVSLDVLDESVRVMSLDGVEPSWDSIKAGTYFLSRPFVMATLGEISEQNELVKSFFSYLASDEGKSVIKSVGLIEVDFQFTDK